MNPRISFSLILILTFLSLLVALPPNFNIPLNLPFRLPIIGNQLNISSFKYDIKKGLDIQGGTQLILEADMSGLDDSNVKDALESAKEIISRRVDLYGVSEPVVQTSEVGGQYRILVELPGLEDVNSAVALVGQTAQLDFREIPEQYRDATPGSVPVFAFTPTGLTGKGLDKATVQFGSNSNNGEPVVGLKFNSEGTKQFAEITKRNINKPLAIFIDGIPITAPIVNDEIISGEAIINGGFTIDSAKELAIQLNAGALPVPVKIIQQRNIGPSLGQESVQKSIRAGMIGLIAVMLFMFMYYGRMGFIADIALIIYGLITLAIYKLIPVTLTLPGIAGFILSVGMAVDANILIFERMTEELRRGRNWKSAMELGFGKAWDSIKDANVATIITALILFNPLNIQWLVTSGMVRGFALTLLIGVLVSMFTGVVVTRTLMRIFYKGK